MTVLPSTRRIPTPTGLAFAAMYGLPAHLANILAGLYDGQTVQADRRQISGLRTALETPEAIDTTDTGYRLTDIGRGECGKALSEFDHWMKGRAA